MKRRKNDDDLTPYLNPRTAEILRLFQEHGSMDRMRAAHPEITDEEVASVTTELMRLMGMFDESPAPKPRKASKRAAAASEAAYQLKITLKGSQPPIWRRVVVPGEIGLDRLHRVIQIAMGWTDSHLHLFEIDDTVYQGRDPFGGKLESHCGELDEAEYRLCDVVREKARFRYEYDFGDGWEHTLVVEKIIPASENPRTMVCLAGKNRCPVEDSGGLWGYYDKLSILADPKHPEYEEVLEWMGEVDPAQFDLDKVNRELATLKP